METQTNGIMNDVCSICGHEISSEASLRSGMGAECRAAYNRALFKACMSTDGASLKYNWLIQVDVLKDAFVQSFENTKFRSEFKKSFYKSICNSERVSKKQLSIIDDWLFMKIGDTTELYEQIKLKKQDYLNELKSDVKITSVAIEMARKEMRTIN